MGIKNVVKKVADRAGNTVAKMTSLSSDQIEAIQLQRENYLLQLHDPSDAVAQDLTHRMMAASSIEIFNAYLSQLKDLYLPAEKDDVWHHKGDRLCLPPTTDGACSTPDW